MEYTTSELIEILSKLPDNAPIHGIRKSGRCKGKRVFISTHFNNGNKRKNIKVELK